jgi:hypothetical protein
MRSAAIVVCVLVLLVQNATCDQPMWKVFCAGTPLVRARVDPLIAPGAVSNHLHNVAGASNFGPATTAMTPLQVYDTLITSTCTTCSLVKVDNSAYWHPELFYRWDNGTYSLVPQGGLTVYYLFRTGPTQPTPAWKAFPPGFRMISGDPFKRSFNASSSASQAISFVCIVSSGPSAPQTNNMSVTDNFFCGDGFRLQVNFPQCWDGVNLDSPTHNTHVVFPIGTNPDSGDCPASHPVRLPELFFEAFYSVSSFPHGPGQGTGRFVLACGDPTGYGFHGDFMTGWNQTIMQQAIQDSTCLSVNTNSGNTVTNCKTLAPYVQNTPAGACVMAKDLLLNENFNLGYPSPTLPGCAPITPGPAEATPCTGAPSATYQPAANFRFLWQSVSTGKYLRAPNSTTTTIKATSTATTYWECWEAVPVNGGVAIQNDVTMLFTSADTGSASSITSSRGTPSGWETFVFTKQSSGYWTIMSLRNNEYLTVQSDYSVGPTTAAAPFPNTALFQLVVPSGGTIS